MDKQRYTFFFIVFAVILVAAVVLRIRQAVAPSGPQARVSSSVAPSLPVTSVPSPHK
ncbi:hypothetical protein HY629_01490 [Candidatus Uhrbacteria bacterium]|nr:hypothetical protein [Candidatus Uhrbacteria bacterium]